MKKALPILVAALLVCISIFQIPAVTAAGPTTISNSKVDELEGLKVDGVTWTSSQLCTSTTCYSEGASVPFKTKLKSLSTNTQYVITVEGDNDCIGSAIWYASFTNFTIVGGTDMTISWPTFPFGGSIRYQVTFKATSSSPTISRLGVLSNTAADCNGDLDVSVPGESVQLAANKIGDICMAWESVIWGQNGIGDCTCANWSNSTDVDDDNVISCFDNCPSVDNTNQADSDNDGQGNACDACVWPTPNNYGASCESPTNACGQLATGTVQCDGSCSGIMPVAEDTDSDGTMDCSDSCPQDANKVAAWICGCGIADTDTDGDGTADCTDQCEQDAAKTAPGTCGCGIADTDTDGDGTLDCTDQCEQDAAKTAPGVCGCGQSDMDSDGDGTADCSDSCSADAEKTTAWICGCGESEVDSDTDGTPDCTDECDDSVDSDEDGTMDCVDECPVDAQKTAEWVCGCDVADTDTDGDGTADCTDQCEQDAAKTEPGVCGCGIADTDTDGDGTLDCTDQCVEDATKTAPGTCGCGVVDVDTDEDGSLDCNDQCVSDASKTLPGVCGCGVSDVDSNENGTPDCNDVSGTGNNEWQWSGPTGDNSTWGTTTGTDTQEWEAGPEWGTSAGTTNGWGWGGGSIGGGGSFNVCGNGIINLNEQCDDGNQVSGDGCDATCNLEAAPIGLAAPTVPTLLDTWPGGSGDTSNSAPASTPNNANGNNTQQWTGDSADADWNGPDTPAATLQLSPQTPWVKLPKMLLETGAEVIKWCTV